MDAERTYVQKSFLYTKKVLIFSPRRTKKEKNSSARIFFPSRSLLLSERVQFSSSSPLQTTRAGWSTASSLNDDLLSHAFPSVRPSVRPARCKVRPILPPSPSKANSDDEDEKTIFSGKVTRVVIEKRRCLITEIAKAEDVSFFKMASAPWTKKPLFFDWLELCHPVSKL